MSEIRANTISDAAGTGPITLTGQSAAKAWVSVQANTNPQTLLGSFNVASITDGGTGLGQINLTSLMSDLNYSATVAKQNSVTNDASETFYRQGSSSSNVIWSFFESGSLTDPIYWVGTVHGDLA